MMKAVSGLRNESRKRTSMTGINMINFELEKGYVTLCNCILLIPLMHFVPNPPKNHPLEGSRLIET
jgi:hypothetical protein